MRRVVITGVGCITPVGRNVEDTWDALMAGRSGVKPLTLFPVEAFSVRFGGEVSNFDPSPTLEKVQARKLDRFVQFGMVAAHEAFKDSGLVVDPERAHRYSVITGSGIGGLWEIEEQHKRLLDKGPDRISPYLIPKLMLNALSGNISIAFGMKGANFATASACASGGHAMAVAMRTIQLGEADVVVSGGSEAAITPLGLGGFCALRALSTRNEAPAEASRPFDKDRDGFVMGEGAGILVLEELEHAKRRGARIYCEIAGAGMTGDAFHITAPADGAEGAQRSMSIALQEAGIGIDDVDYINAHGTSTPLNDVNESQAIEAVFKGRAKQLAVNSTKSMIGHLLGASQAVGAVVCALSIHRHGIHQTLNHLTAGEGCNLDYVKGCARDLPIRAAISNSLGFGGHNVSLAFKRFA